MYLKTQKQKGILRAQTGTQVQLISSEDLMSQHVLIGFRPTEISPNYMKHLLSGRS